MCCCTRAWALRLQPLITATPEHPWMTRGRAALVEILDGYTRQTLLGPGLVESREFRNFLQAPANRCA